MNFFTVSLSDVRLYAHHGVFPHEKRDGNEFRIEMDVKYYASPEKENDDSLDNTISYAELFEIVRHKMGTPKNLLETVARDICETVKTRFPQTFHIECRITKLSPPISGLIGSASVSYTMTE